MMLDVDSYLRRVESLGLPPAATTARRFASLHQDPYKRCAWAWDRYVNQPERDSFKLTNVGFEATP